MKKKEIVVRSKEEIEQILDDAWLGITVDERKLFNPLASIPEEFEDEPHLYIMWLMAQPEYFFFTCKEILGVELLPFQCVILREMWNRRFPMLIASRGGSKTFLLAVYSLLRLIFMPGRRIVGCGAAFRQSKLIFEYMEAIWANAPLLRDMVGGGRSERTGPKRDPDRCRFYINDSVASFLPIGDGQKIRGERAHDILADEFASISKEVFENVIAGFGVVQSSPAETVRNKAKKKLIKQLNLEGYIDTDNRYDSLVKSNQIIFSGTAYYDFNHFAEYWKKWCQIIKSNGEDKKLQKIFGDDDDGIPDDFDWSNYSVIRLPYKTLPYGFLDEAMVARSKATIHSGIYLMEFGAVFTNDSNGFFRRSLIESCVANDEHCITLPSGGPITFEPTLYGDTNKRYVYGIDPASEIDNFSIVIMEIHGDHQRVVYAWTTTVTEHKERVKAGLISETDFYSYCARKIRDLMKKFPCERICMDSQGGGIAVREALHDNDKLREGELSIWPLIDPEKEQDTDGEPGLHILDLVNFASFDWTSEANHGLRKDMEDKVCLFPMISPATLGLSMSISEFSGKSVYDTLEDCYMEIEELKNELSSIIITSTTTGRDRWDTPEVKLPGNKKGRLRKDRYSALLMANMGCRQIMRSPKIEYNTAFGGFAESVKPELMTGDDFTGPAWFTNKMNDVYD